MKKSNDFIENLKKKGNGIVNKAKEGYKSVKITVEKNFLNDSLKRRFNQENPYKFIIMNDKEKASVIDELMPKHAKRYLEDDIFVFYGSKEDNDISVGYFIKDISDGTMYEVEETVDVKIPVVYENESYEVDALAVYGKIL
jgi:hypothetical protein